MKVIMYIAGAAISHFPMFSEFEKQGVTVLAERTGPSTVRWTLTGPEKAIWTYIKTARKLGLRYQVTHAVC